MVLKSGVNMMPREPVFTTKIIVVMNGSVMTTKQERFADKEKKNPSSISFTVSFRGDLQYEGTLNLNEGIISICYTKKSIKNTTIGYRLENNTLFFQICRKGIRQDV